MPKTEEVPAVEERPTPSSVETRTASPTVERPDHNPISEVTNSMSSDLPSSGEAEYTATTTTMNTAEGTEEQYSSSTPLSTAEDTLGQYSTEDFVLVRGVNEEAANEGTNRPEEIPSTSNGHPTGEYTPGDQEEVEIIQVVERKKRSIEEQLRIITDYYSKMPDVVPSTATTSQQSVQIESNDNDVIKKIKQQVKDLIEAKKIDQIIINRLHIFIIHLYDLVKKGKLVSNMEMLRQLVQLKADYENARREKEDLSKSQEQTDRENTIARGDKIYFQKLYEKEMKRADKISNLRKTEKNELENKVKKNTKEIDELELKNKKLKEELGEYKHLTRETEELQNQRKKLTEEYKIKADILMKEREVEQKKYADLRLEVARLQAKNRKIAHEKEEALKAKEEVIVKPGNENAVLENKVGDLRRQIEDLRTLNVASRKPGPRREGDGGEALSRSVNINADVSAEGGEPSIDPTVAPVRPGLRREVEGEGSIDECINTIPEITPEDPEMVEGPVEAQTTTSMDGRKEIGGPKSTGTVPISSSEREKRNNKKLREQRKAYREEVNKLQKVIDQRDKEIEEKDRQIRISKEMKPSQYREAQTQTPKTHWRLSKPSQYRETTTQTPEAHLEPPKPVNPTPPPREVSPQNRGDTPTPFIVVKVNKNNKHLVSRVDKGLLVNRDGSLSRTPQYETWIKNTRMQLEKHFGSTPKFPEELRHILNHPKPTSLDLIWTHEGEWYMFSTRGGEEGEEPTNQRVVRVERYIDLEGTIRRAFSYGEEDTRLGEWYNFEEMKKAFPSWNPPDNSIYYNNRRFCNQIKRTSGGIQTPKPIPRARGRGRPTYREEKRPTHKNQDWSREKKREYMDWDRNQATSSRNEGRRYEQEYSEERRRGRSPTPSRKEKIRYEKRFRSPSYDEEMRGRGRGRRRSRSHSSSRRFLSHR